MKQAPGGRWQRGFTLIELAIVLLIIGLLTAGGSMLLGPMLNKGYRDQTKARLDQIEKALVLFAANNDRLPCPSNSSLGSGSSSNGAEIACSSTMTFGGLPWRAMGLTEADVLDGWGRRISYAVTTALTVSANTPLDCPVKGFALITQGVLQSRGASDQVIPPSPPVVAISAADSAKAAYVIISHGENGGLARMPSGAQMALGGASETEALNVKALGGSLSSEVIFYYEKRAAADGVTGFDDIVRSRTAGQIAIEYGCVTP